MTFISCAQNFEDVMLWRVLKHVHKGFYIDVGAAWPEQHSVTKSFYDNGWRGINIEPNPEFYSQLREQRSNDINLPVAISDKPGSMIMNFIGGTGLSTLDKTIANIHRDTGWGIIKQQVEVTTLATIWNSYVSSDQEVHFLKVDVEGLEEAVLRSNDWQYCRPWIVVVEATLPMSQEESYRAWDSLLLSVDYQFAYADGLNRFYVAQEHSELLPAFKYPPNVFDDFVLSSQKEAEEQAREANERAQEATSRLLAIEDSLSWKITAPLRWLSSTIASARFWNHRENQKTLRK